MNRLEFLLIKVAEEASEIAQIALKTAQFGLEEVKPGQSLTNRERMYHELDDLNAMVALLNKEFNFEYEPSSTRQLIKIVKVEDYYQYSRDKCGTIQE